jgi:hypothetical protein
MGRRGAKVKALEAMARVAPLVVAPAPAVPLKLNLGSGPSKMEGFVSVDKLPFDGVQQLDLGNDPWPWADNSVDEAMASHLFEHLVPEERRHFMNELYRVMKPCPVGQTGIRAQIVTPHWASHRAYGDPTHAWPPVCEMTFWYHNEAWRKVNAPHLEGYAADWEVLQPSYSLHPALLTRAVEHQQERLQWAKEAAQDMIQVLIKREKVAAP